MEIFNYLLIVFQIIVGYNLFAPFLFYCLWLILRPSSKARLNDNFSIDYAIVVTAYEQIHTLPFVIESILRLNYSNYLVYVVADKCDISTLIFDDPKIIILRPPVTLGSNTRSHQYAVEHFVRRHDMITIIDSDNLVDSRYLLELNKFVDEGYSVIQGVRKAKNLNTNIARLDAARDIFYHFYDGIVLHQVGSSATLSGSGMAFKFDIYSSFLKANDVVGAGFDKVLQAWLVKLNYRIAFAEKALVYDEKTAKSDQLVKQRSRWINTWFKYFFLGFKLMFLGTKSVNRNQFLFGSILLRPPLFIFLILSMIALFINILIGKYLIALVWIVGFILFGASFLISLRFSKADASIYRSLVGIPKFIFYQLLSLLKVRKANSLSVATKHEVTENH